MSSRSFDGDTGRPSWDSGLLGRLWAIRGVSGQMAWLVQRHPQHRIFLRSGDETEPKYCCMGWTTMYLCALPDTARRPPEMIMHPCKTRAAQQWAAFKCVSAGLRPPDIASGVSIFIGGDEGQGSPCLLLLHLGLLPHVACSGFNPNRDADDRVCKNVET